MLRRLTLMFLVLALTVIAVSAQDATPEATPDAQAPVAPVYLGIAFEAADNGITVTGLDPRGPAADADVKVGDVITAIDGAAVTADTVVETLSGYQAGDEVVLSVERAGEAQDITVTLVSRDDSTRRPPNNRPAMPRLDTRPLLGVHLAENEAGAEVTEVVAGTAADDAGLKAGDIITAINGETVTTPQEAQDAVGALAVGDTITVTVTRDGESLDIEATLGSMPDNAPIPMPRGEGRPHDFMMPIQPGVFTYLPDENVYEVGDLPEDSPYYEAGLRSADRITAINGDSVNELLFNLHGAETVTVTVERDGAAQDIEVPGTIVLDLMMGMGGGMLMPDMHGMIVPPLNARLGLMFVMLDEKVAADLDIEQTEGAYIRAVDSDSPAAEAGVLEGDIITAVDGQTLSADLTLRDSIMDKNPGDDVTLTVLRDGETQDITVTLGEPQDRFDFEHPVIPGEGRPRT